MLKRTALRFMLLAMAFSCLLFSAAPLYAQDEPKAPLIPPLTGDGSDQTYMQAIWVIIIFVILLAILYPVAWKNVLAGLKKREDRIRRDIAEAESARFKADESLKQYNARLQEADQKIQVLLGQAATDAEKIATNIKMRAQHDAEEAKERATKEIESAKQAALTEIYQQTADLATTIAEKIIRRNLNVDDQRDLVNQSLDQLQSVHTN